MTSRTSPAWFSAIAPGLLVAATGVGAGDLLTASLAGSAVGVGILWAAVAGAFLKWTLNEGIGRWQMATGTTLLEGWVTHLGRPMTWVFSCYLVLWSFAVGGALVNACGVAGTSLLPLGGPESSKVCWGIIHSAAGVVLVLLGGFRLFERLMAVSIAGMFVLVVTTAVLIGPDWQAVAKGIVTPSIPPGGLAWVLGVLGGVGGTVTLLSYGYWIREERREGWEGVRACRIDLAVGYALTACFGLAMVIIGSKVEIQGRGAQVALLLADQLEIALGPVGRGAFLLGFWAAVFSSLLGVWQSVPYLFTDLFLLGRAVPADERRQIDFTRSLPYRAYLVGIATVPLSALWWSVEEIQLTYAVLGALFMPLVALTLLILNNRIDRVGERFKNGRFTNLVLAATLAFFTYQGVRTLYEKLSGP